jgi:hypothetical protein
MTAPPLRFLALALGGWICIRAAILAPGWTATEGRNSPAAAARPALTRAEAAAFADIAAPAAVKAGNSLKRPRHRAELGQPRLPADRPPATAAPLPDPGPTETQSVRPPEPIQPLAPPPAGHAGRAWSVSAWLLLRGEGRGSALVPAGTLGGSQAGARIRYRLASGLSLSGRAYLPLRRPQGAEAAAGVEWQPVAAIPVAILAERRQALGREGRSAFSVLVHGGISRALPGGLRLDAYAQAGVVGSRSRDGFVDASARLSARLGPVEIAAGAWGAAQPGAARLDAGPGVIYRLPLAGPNLRLEASWRFRVLGEAAPGSGPALILTADF